MKDWSKFAWSCILPASVQEKLLSENLIAYARNAEHERLIMHVNAVLRKAKLPLQFAPATSLKGVAFKWLMEAQENALFTGVEYKDKVDGPLLTLRTGKEASWSRTLLDDFAYLPLEINIQDGIHQEIWSGRVAADDESLLEFSEGRVLLKRNWTRHILADVRNRKISIAEVEQMLAVAAFSLFLGVEISVLTEYLYDHFGMHLMRMQEEMLKKERV
jgi:hypothetical protein